MKSNTAIKTMVIAFVVMLGMTGLGAAITYDSSVTLDNKDSTWALTPNDGIGAVINYDLSGDEFVWSASGVALVNTEYLLIYYADKPDRFNNWGGDNPGALIGTITTNNTGVITGSGSIDLNMDLPCSPDANIDIYDYCESDGYDNCHGAKLWMVPSCLLSGYPGPSAWIAGWSWSAACQPVILFETDLITYTDCDLSITSPCQPDNATIEAGDTFGGTVPITVADATNAGSVDLIVTYNSSIVTVTGASGSAMYNTYCTIGTDSVHILAYQQDNPGLNGDFTLATLTFTTVGSESCDFNISVTSFLDATPCVRAMPYLTSDGEYCACSNGDVNCDGAVNSGDVMYLAKHLVSITGFDTISECASDVDGSGTIDVNDVAYLAKHLVGKTGYETLL